MRAPRALAAVVLVAGTALIGAVGAMPPAGAAVTYQEITKDYIVPTGDAELFLEVVHPSLDGTTILPAPVILTYTPYAVLGRNGDASHWVDQKGYTRATADVIGTGNSGGCYDYGGGGEKRTAEELIDWIASQSWSDDAIAMLGGSYEGTTQYAAAAQIADDLISHPDNVKHPEALKTIVPEAAIDRWYDYAYSGGIRYTDTNEDLGNEGAGTAGDEGVDTPLGFDFGFAIPPPIDNTDPDWAQRVDSTIRPCHELDHTSEAYSDQPDYGGFWDERDYLRDMPKVQIPVLVATNWGDWNVKQVDGWQIIHALTNSPDSRAIFGGRWFGHGVPQNVANSLSYKATVDAWMDHWLRGVDDGVPASLPRITSRSSDETKTPGLPYTAAPDTRSLHLTLSHDANGFALTPDGGASAAGSPAASYLWTQATTESGAGLQPFAAAPGYVGFASPTLQHDLRVYGEPVLHFWSTTQGQWETTAVSLLDFDPANYQGTGAETTATNKNAVIAFTRGWLDSRYRDGLDREVNATPNESFAQNLSLKPTDYTVRAGHRIVLLMSTETLEWAKSKVPPAGSSSVTVDYANGQSWLDVPASVDSGDVFSGNPVLPETPVVVLLPIVAVVMTAAGYLVRRRLRLSRQP